MVHVFLRHPVGVKNYQNEKKASAELGHSDLLLVLILPKCLYLKKCWTDFNLQIKFFQIYVTGQSKMAVSWSY